MSDCAVTPGNVRFEGGFWGDRIDLVLDKALPYQWEILNDRVEGAVPSHAIENFRIAAGLSRGEYHGMVFQDSDVGKWLEAVGYALMIRPNPELQRLADETIDLIEKAQQPDGYLNTYYTIKEPGKRWTNIRESHEMYCAGHMMEAAVAYFQATGKRRLLDVMLRMARHIDSVIGPEEGKMHAFPGHQEIELALVKMYGVTGERFLLKLADYFLRQRGTEPNYFVEERAGREETAFKGLDRRYWQNHKPILEQEALVGHAVRALYMATGMAMVARETGDDQMIAACGRLFDNLVQKRMYITGGAGSSDVGEAFTTDYDLPNDRAYAETCAAIALCFFARAMLGIRPDSRYADALERALYNGALAGISLDGLHFFYVNPLEVVPELCEERADTAHVLPVRPSWFSCACCPTNVVRLMLSLGQYLFQAEAGRIYVHTYAACSAEVPMGDGTVRLKVSGSYPWDGAVRLYPGEGAYALMLRIPGWAEGYTVRVGGEAVGGTLEDGYFRLERAWKGVECVELDLPMRPRRVYANPLLRADNGQVAVTCGPLVYCLEGADNGAALGALILPEGAELVRRERPDKLGGIVEICARGARERADADMPLYAYDRPGRDPAELVWIPYFAWANRGINEMRVWIRNR